jgi:hypothetical protein
MDLMRKLAGEGTEHVEKLVRLVAAAGIGVRPVDHLLGHEVALRMSAEVGALQEEAKVGQVAVEVAAHEDLAGMELHESAATAGLVAV